MKTQKTLIEALVLLTLIAGLTRTLFMASALARFFNPQPDPPGSQH